MLKANYSATSFRLHATAIIDRLLYRCEVIKLAGTSYRLENRKTIFTSESTVNGKQLRRAASTTIQTQQ